MNAAAPPLETLAQLYARPGFLLRRAHQISAAVFEDACAPLGLTQAQYGAMTVLAAAPGLDQTRLARALAFDKVTALRVLRGLQARGLVERAPVPGNARQLAVQLTVAGHDTLAQAQQAAQAAYQRLLQPLAPPQQQQLVQLLAQLTDGLAHAARAPFVPLTGHPG
ncbi:MarR family winged helix-turn-helix transcriptional regulator [Aquabacterium sp. A08]|uniref:MarR family winged helix-turn-helix transcriptional regulator n=1 Tax=Aquabacterium sp. A08 TaxID=2718532 RepID=UPI00142070D3|nr:MarR family transcriptional regulator [Aquabacterium sp. A08]NIC42528.1 MarR family transcriptional regulator [Aquabacterium sp. A08]NIC42553.1 MarR family transcriptional regulator [Aquabacterium sp. A08]NIC42558.1 MarR family transcriptional regulator [Aquabacterium sp. A08]